MKRVTVQLVLDEDIVERLKHVAKQEHEALSVIARRILRAHLPPVQAPALPATHDTLAEVVA